MPSSEAVPLPFAATGAGWPARLVHGADALFTLARVREIRLRTVHDALLDISRISSVALGVDRTSVWRFSDGQLRCTLLIRGGEVAPESEWSDLVVEAESCPEYMARLAQPFAIAIDDARTHPSCRGLETHLRAHDVGARLDVPLSVGGELLGAICHEHTGGPRHWTADEAVFCNLVGTVILTQLEAERRLRAERRADGSEARYAHLVETLPVLVYAFDIRTGALDYLSPNIVELGGLSLAQWTERGGVEAWVASIEPADRGPVLRRFQDPAAEGFEPDLTYRIRLPDGSRRYLRDRCAVVRGAAGVPVALHGMVADVTAEHEAQLLNREHARRFDELLTHAELGAVTVDRSGRVVDVNDALVRLTRRERAQLVGADWFEQVVAPPDRDLARAQFLADLARGELSARTETRVTTADGEARAVLWSHTALRDLEGRIEGRTSLGVDVTDRDRLLQRHHHAERLESLGRLAAVVAHDFNSLLGVIKLTADELERGDADGAARADQVTAVEQAQALVRSLLAFSKREAAVGGAIALDAELRSAQPILSRVAGPAQRFELQAAAPDARVALDRTQLQQVLMNLVTNAAQAMEAQPGTVMVRSRVATPSAEQCARHGLDAPREHACVSVEDQGVGVPPELRELIFEPFFTSKVERGTGLGLATALAVVRGAGGFIELDSAPGAGSVFSVWLPRVG